jgi:hypothetical protein
VGKTERLPSGWSAAGEAHRSVSWLRLRKNGGVNIPHINVGIVGPRLVASLARLSMSQTIQVPTEKVHVLASVPKELEVHIPTAKEERAQQEPFYLKLPKYSRRRR